MRKSTISIIAFILLFCACKKTSTGIHQTVDPTIENARAYFEQTVKGQDVLENSAAPSPTNPRFPSSRTVLWNKAVTRQTGSVKTVIVPVAYSQPFYMGTNTDIHRLYSSNEVTRLFVYSDRYNNYHAEQVSYFPDSNFANSSFSGLITVDDWSGNAINKYRVEKNGRLSKWNGILSQDSLSRVTTNGIEENVTYTMETCYEIYGVNSSADEPEKLYPWTQVAGCTYQVVTDGYDDVGSSGTLPSGQYATSAPVAGSTGGSITPVPTVTVLSGSNVIGNINDYDKCFTNIAGNSSSYTVTVCVSEPIPSKRTAWGVIGTGSTAAGNIVNVGHTFMVLTQTTGSGTTTRNVGFYPQGSVTPLSPGSQGQLNNDASHAYNISLSITLTNSQFFQVLNFIDQGNNAGYLYNLNTNNCTTFTIDALRTAGINLPSTTGSWPGGSGFDPGDLGEDIRTMSLSAGMTRATSSVAHPNLGTCN